MRNCYQDKISTCNVIYVYYGTLRYVSLETTAKTNNISCKLCLTSSYLPDIKWLPQTLLRWLPRVITNIVLIERELEKET